MVCLEVCGLVGDQRICGGVRFVESVAREFLHQIEQLIGAGFLEAAPACAFTENAAVLRHLLGQLLAHCAPQKIGGAETVAADDLRH